jgi:hypothetical protein
MPEVQMLAGATVTVDVAMHLHGQPVNVVVARTLLAIKYFSVLSTANVCDTNSCNTYHSAMLQTVVKHYRVLSTAPTYVIRKAAMLTIL